MTTLTSPPPASELIAKYDGRTPRYTSYPTAVQFSADVDAALYRRWLGALPADDPVSLYLHVPFCARLCWYCGCNTRAVNRHGPVGEYVQHLIGELHLLEAALPGRLGLASVHLGGGTPNMLTPEELSEIFVHLRRAFHCAPRLEIAAELDPAVLTPAWAAAAGSLGLARASLGVQNLAPEVQDAVNRRESFEHLAVCVDWLRAAGVRSVNLDLMYGLPRQTCANTLSTLDSVLRLRPDRLALFGYAHVPWMKPHQKLIDENALPSAGERLDQSETAAARLVSEGYVRIGIDHFALPSDSLAVAAAGGRLRRNFQGYTADPPATLLGLGASAIGSLPQGYVQNTAQEVGWRAAIARGELPVARGVALTSEDRFRAEIIERLMCDFRVDLGAVCARHARPISVLAPEMEGLGPFIADGLARRRGDVLEVTEEGRVLVRSISAVFDTYLDRSAGRHARTM
jgi:oxygen-independent coproporphyrinogen-3 oxidase